MNKAITLRHADEKDLSEIVDLANQWAAEESTIGQEAGTFDQYLNASAYLIVAEENGVIIGFLAADTKNEHLAVFDGVRPYIELEELYVTPGRRSRGVGSLLVSELKTTAKAKGQNRFHVYSASRDLGAVIAFYRKHGFQVWSIQAYADENET